MFCSNCGKPLADNAKFCSNCGAPVALPVGSTTEERTPAPAVKPVAQKPSAALDLEWGTGVTPEPKKAERKVSFDWSSVIDDTRRKPRTEIKSPWDTDYEEEPVYKTPATSLEDEVFAEATASKKSDERGRTLTFIDILKQEREEKERKAYDAARRIEDDVLSNGFDEPLEANTILPKDERIVTQGYTDLKNDIIAEMEKDTVSPFDEQFASAKEKRNNRAPLFTPEPPRSFVDDFMTGTPAKAAAPHEEEAPEPVQEPVIEETPAPTLEEELTAILEEGAPIIDEPVAQDIPEVQLPEADDEPEVIETEDLFANEVEEPVEEPVAEEEPAEEPEEVDPYEAYMDYVPRGRAARNRYDEEEFDDEDEDDEDDIPEEATGEEEPAEEPEETLDAVDDEILALQKKLEALLAMKNGTAVAEPVAEEEPVVEEPEVEEPVEDTTEEFGEYLDDDIFEAELVNDEEEEIELPEDITTEPAIVEEPVEEATEENTVFDDDATASIEALLSDLLPAEAMSDAPLNMPVEEIAEVEEEIADVTEEVVEEAIEEPVIEVAPEESLSLDELESALDEIAIETESIASVPETPELSLDDIIEVTPVIEDVPVDPAVVNIDAELAKLGFGEDDIEAAVEPVVEEPVYNEEDMLFTHETTDTNDTVAISTSDLAAQEAMSIEELERDIFGPTDDVETEATKKIEKFYTLYRKNDEFQKLLDAEYDKLQGSKYDGPAPEDSILGSAPDLTPLEELIAEPAPIKEAAPEPVKVAEAPVPEKKEAAPAKKADKKADKKAAKAAAKAAKKAKEVEEFDDEDGKGGGILTVLAIIVALLLVVLLVIILVLNFAPDSGIAQTLNEIIGNFTNLFASTDNTELLL